MAWVPDWGYNSRLAAETVKPSMLTPGDVKMAASVVLGSRIG